MSDDKENGRVVIRLPAQMAHDLTMIGFLRDPQMRLSQMLAEVVTDYLKKNPAPLMVQQKTGAPLKVARK